MKANGGGVSFPVVFYDGEHETNIGNITIHPSMDFKIFQSILSQTIGISSHQFTVYRVDKNDARLMPPESRRRSPITAKASFAAIARDRDCCFLVVLKRSRKDRRRKNSINLFQEGGQDFYDFPPLYPRPQPVRYEQQQPQPVRYEQQQPQPVRYEQQQPPQPQPQDVPENFVLLRRNVEVVTNHQQYNGYETAPYCDPVATAEYLEEYKRRFREDYYMMMSANANSNFDNYSQNTMMNYGFPNNNEVVCEECWYAKLKGTPAEFHCCIYDPPVEFFKTTAGAIARPVKDPPEKPFREEVHDGDDGRRNCYSLF